MKRYAAHTTKGKVATHKNSFPSTRKERMVATREYLKPVRDRFTVLGAPNGGYRVVVWPTGDNPLAGCCEIKVFNGRHADAEAHKLADRLNDALVGHRRCAGDSKCSYPVLRGGAFCHYHDRLS